MKIIVLGAGETGKLLAQQLSQRQHKITLIDEVANLLTSLSEVLEVSTVCGNGSEAAILREAQAGSADLFLAVTNNQYVNLLAGSIAKGMGAKKAIAKVNVPMQDSQEYFDYKNHFGLDYIFSSEELAAAESYKYLLGEEATGIEQVGRGRITIQTVLVSAQSKLTGSPILSLKLPPDARLAVIHRQSEVIIPKGHHTLEAEDKVTLFGEKKQVEDLAQSLTANEWLAETKKITIYGGTDYGLALADLLQDKRFKVRIIEKDPKVCGMLSKKLPNTVVIQGDGRSLSLLREEQVDGTDYYIASSLDDEENIMACLQANSIGVKHVIPLVHDADNSRIVLKNLRQFDFLATVSPRFVNHRELLRFVESNELHHVGFLSDDVELVQFTVRANAGVVGKKVMEVKWPEGSSLVTFLRNDQVIVPYGHVEIHAGDALYAVVLPDAGRPLRDLLTR